MGCVSSSVSAAVHGPHHGEPLYGTHPKLAEHRGHFLALGLTEEELWQIYDVFVKMDRDGSGEISLVELLDYLRLERTKFNKRVFSIFDEDGSGEVDFREFVIALWNYCTLSKTALVLFAFDLYDADGSGAIEFGEMEQLLREVYGKKFAQSPMAAKILEKIDKMAGDLAVNPEITVDRFSKFCHRHPGLLFPAFQFQMDLRRKIIGERFWDKMSEKRVQLSDGKEVTVRELLDAHVNEVAFNNMTRNHDATRVSVDKLNSNKAFGTQAANQGAGGGADFDLVFRATGRWCPSSLSHTRALSPSRSLPLST